MALTRRKPEVLETLQVGVVEPSLPAEPGAERAFRDIYVRIHDRALDHAQRFLDYERAWDAVHDAFASILKEWPRLRPEQRVDAYFFGAVHHAVLAQLRRDKRYVELSDAEQELTRVAIEAIDATPGQGDVELADIIDHVVGDMPPRRKQVFLLIREQGMTYREVAELLAISVASVNTHVTLANEALRAALERAGFKLPAGPSRPALKPGTPEASNG